MSTVLTVVLGAGASFDSVPGSKSLGVRWQWKPPLTSELFGPKRESVQSAAVHHDRSGNFHGVLSNFPRAKSLVNVIEQAIARGKTMEESLRELRDDEDHIAMQFQQIPLYIRELLGHVSDSFLPENNSTDNLDALVRRLIRRDVERVAFITLNYDVLLEKSLEVAGDRISPRHGLDWYIQASTKWIMLKLHGSVDWGRSITQVRNLDSANLAVLLSIMDAFDLKKNHLGPIEKLPTNSGSWVWNGALYYPALAIPVDDDYPPVCPPQHLAQAEDFVTNCENFLFIGVRGKDRDLLDLLGKARNCRSIGVVAENEKAVAETFNNVASALRCSIALDAFPVGLTAFVGDGYLNDFIARLN